MTLRPYQEEFIAGILGQLGQYPPAYQWQDQGPHQASTIGVMPTGGGKTHCAVEIVKRAIAGALPGIRSAAFWCDLKEIRSDTVERFEKIMTVGIHAAGHAPTPYFPVQIVQVQTAINRPPPPADLIIFDECHTLSEGSKASELLRQSPPKYLIGLTATPSRGDGKGLGETFRSVVMGPSVKQLQDMGALVSCQIYAGAPECFQKGLACTVKDAMGPPVEGKRVLVFVADRRAKETAQELAAAGWRSEVLAAETHPKIRKTQRERLATGELQVLVTVDCATKGWDCPAIDHVVIARPVGVTGLYLQMIGRGLRPSPSTGKTHCNVLDLRGCVWVHGMPEWEREWSLDGVATGRQSVKVKTTLAYCSGCGWIGAPNKALICPGCGGKLAPPLPPQAKHLTALERLQGLHPEELAAKMWKATYDGVFLRMMRSGKSQSQSAVIAQSAADKQIERMLKA